MQITEMTTAIATLVEAIKTDYLDWTERSAIARGKRDGGDGELNDINKRMIAEFNNELSYTVGNKYIKIVKGGSVWGFVINTDTDKKFKRGDILKAASWNAPARNAARGNVFTGFKVNWTGPNYLR